MWLAVSSILCTLDIIYTTLRPHTNRGGALEHIYEFWNWYADVDLRYANEKDHVTMATGRVMIVEVALNLLALILAHRGSRHTQLLTFTTSAFVFWKTVWYLALFVRVPEGEPTYLAPTASFWQLLWIFWVADGVWVVMPLAVMIVLWNRLAVARSEDDLPFYLHERTPSYGLVDGLVETL